MSDAERETCSYIDEIAFLVLFAMNHPKSLSIIEFLYSILSLVPVLLFALMFLMNQVD